MRKKQLFCINLGRFFVNFSEVFTFEVMRLAKFVGFEIALTKISLS